MTRKKPHTAQSAEATPHSKDSISKNKYAFLSTKWGKLLPYLLTFFCLWTFSTFIYGEVFTRTVQESFVTSDAELMKHLTDQSFGNLYFFGRYLLLIFHSKWIGGTVLSVLLTAVVYFLDKALRLPQCLRGVSAIVPAALLLLWGNEGINIYYKNEPSLFVLQALGLFIVALLATLISKIIGHKTSANPPSATVNVNGWKRWPIGTLIALLTLIPLNVYTSNSAENTILTAKMQNRILENDIYPLIEDGLSAKQPTRSVAAYYAIGLVQTDLLLEHLFDISFHFPDIHLQTNDGSGEYGIFNADCNFYAGLINSSYRSAMDQTVMNGPRLYYLKRIALCAILNQEKALALKYMDIISKVPFESEFVETYSPMIEQPELIAQHPSFSKVLALNPTEQRFEQNYRSPAFLGYNIGMMEGSNSALAPSMAACMYSKDLPNLALRAFQYKKITGTLPLAVQEALSIHARKNPDLYQYFPELNDANLRLPHPANANVNNFYLSIQSHFQEKYQSNDWRQKMSEELKGGITEDLRELIIRDWKGHYVYYYYCENINQKKEEKQESSGVN